MRKIIQICSSRYSVDLCRADITALCDDGTVWYMQEDGEGWCATMPIPQDEEEEPYILAEYKKGDRIQHRHSDEIGTITCLDSPGFRTVTVQWDIDPRETIICKSQIKPFKEPMLVINKPEEGIIGVVPESAIHIKGEES